MADGHYCIRIYVMCAGFSFSPEPLLILLESIKCIFIFKQKKVKSLPNEIIEANNGHSRHALIVAVVHFFFFFFFWPVELFWRFLLIAITSQNIYGAIIIITITIIMMEMWNSNNIPTYILYNKIYLKNSL